MTYNEALTIMTEIFYKDIKVGEDDISIYIPCDLAHFYDAVELSMKAIDMMIRLDKTTKEVKI